MNNELINGDINSEWNYNNTHGIFNGLHNMSLNNSCSNNNNVNVLSKEYYANLNNKNSRKKKYFSKSSLTINTCNFNDSSNSIINNTLLQQHNNKCLITHINKPKSYLNLKTAITTSTNNNKSHLSTLTSLYSTTSNSFLNNNKHKHNKHLPKQHSYNHHHNTLYKSNPPIQTSPSVIKNPFATIYGSTKYQRQYIPSYSMKYHINSKNKTKSERNNCISLRNKKLNAVYNNGYCILKRSERVKKNIIHTTIQHDKHYPLKNNNNKEEVEKLIDFIYDKNELYERMFKLGRYKMNNDILGKLNDNVVYRYGKFTKGKSQKEFMFK